MLECVTFSFMDHAHAALFGGGDLSLRVINPIAADLDQMRPTPVATLLAAARGNALRGLPDCALFEAGPAFAPGSQQQVLAAVRTGHAPRSWAISAHAADPLAAKADAVAVLAALGCRPKA